MNPGPLSAHPAQPSATDTLAVVFEAPRVIALRRLGLSPPGEEDVTVACDWSGISTGTERLLWSGRMPAFPGLGYPLVPGYESAGHVIDAGPRSGRRVGEFVFVPGARCFGDVRGLFGGAASHLVVPGARALPVDPTLGEHAVLLALAATAHHALAAPGARPPDLVVGHGALGRLLVRIAAALGFAPPTVWERDPDRREDAEPDCCVIEPEADARRDYHAIYDVSGDGSLLDGLIARTRPGAEIVLAGFYGERLDFAFPPAFQREARLRIAAEWQPADLEAVKALIGSGRLRLGGLITHRRMAAEAPSAYRTAFADPACLKMILDWRESA